MTKTKAHFAAGGGGVGAALGTMLAPVIWGSDVSGEMTAALAVVLTAGLGWGATYFAPANRAK